MNPITPFPTKNTNKNSKKGHTFFYQICFFKMQKIKTSKTMYPSRLIKKTSSMQINTSTINPRSQGQETKEGRKKTRSKLKRCRSRHALPPTPPRTPYQPTPPKRTRDCPKEIEQKRIKEVQDRGESTNPNDRGRPDCLLPLEFRPNHARTQLEFSNEAAPIHPLSLSLSFFPAIYCR